MSRRIFDQDWHLAKRNYDLALETNPEASFPVRLALVKLYARSIWASLTGSPQRALSLWGAPSQGTAVGEHAEDGWTIGSVKDSFKKRWSERGELERDGDDSTRGGWTESGEEPGGERGREGEYDSGDWLGVNGGEAGEEEEGDEAWVEVSPQLVSRYRSLMRTEHLS